MTGILARVRPGGAVDAPIDPRVRARRDEVARDRRRRRTRRFVAVLVIAALLVGAAALTRSPLLDVDQVQVVGAGQATPASVRAAAGIDRGRAMVSVDPDAVAARVARQPWIRTARVERRWPGTVRITVTERTPLAVAGHGDAAVLVDAQGRVLGPAGTAADGLPRVARDPADPGAVLGPNARRSLAVVGSLPLRVRRQVRLVRSTPEATTLRLRSGILVRWGDRTDGRRKATALAVLLRQPDADRIATVDVTVPSAAALTFRDGGPN